MVTVAAMLFTMLAEMLALAAMLGSMLTAKMLAAKTRTVVANFTLALRSSSPGLIILVLSLFWPSKVPQNRVFCLMAGALAV